MKRYLRDDVFGMSRVRTKYCRPELKKLIPGFIYVSSKEASHGPRVKFDGGTKETNKKGTCPSMAFDKDGNCKVLLQPWMNKDNCPNGYDNDTVNKVKTFVNMELPVLLLMWFERVDEATAYNYLQGFVDFEELVEEAGIPSSVTNMKELDEYCRQNDLYSF